MENANGPAKGICGTCITSWQIFSGLTNKAISAGVSWKATRKRCSGSIPLVKMIGSIDFQQGMENAQRRNAGQNISPS
jgi:hypothetical protein